MIHVVTYTQRPHKGGERSLARMSVSQALYVHFDALVDHFDL